MFNIVKRRDFMLGQNVSTKEEAEQAAREYGADYVAVRVKEDEPAVVNRDKMSSFA